MLWLKIEKNNYHTTRGAQLFHVIILCVRSVTIFDRFLLKLLRI